jgi:hypothetical protein
MHLGAHSTGAVTYSDCGEDILELVYERNQPRVVYVDAVHLLAFCATRGYLRYVPTHSGCSPWLALCGVKVCRRRQYSRKRGG